MDAFCPHCGKSLEYRQGNVPEFVPFFGAIGAGKTHLLFSVVSQLLQWSEEAGRRPEDTDKKTSTVEQPDRERPDEGRPGIERQMRERFMAKLADSATTAKLKNASKWLSPESAMGKALPGLPQTYIIRLTIGHDTRLLHMFDATGEFFHIPEHAHELRYLSKASTFILVIDPLSVEAFWDRLLPDQQVELKAVRSAAPSPDLAYQLAYQRIEAMGVQLRKARLAVVFTRADLIDAPTDDAATWAIDALGLSNLVRSARLDFKEARFFCTASVMTDGVMHKSVSVLIRWVLARNGINLSGDMS